jgi:hypothetical protein
MVLVPLPSRHEAGAIRPDRFWLVRAAAPGLPPAGAAVRSRSPLGRRRGSLVGARCAACVRRRGGTRWFAHNSSANAVTSLLHAEVYKHNCSAASQRPLRVAPAQHACRVCSANLRCRRRRLRIINHPTGRRKRRSVAQARAVHARAWCSELPRPQLDRRAHHPQRHQHERSRLQIRPRSLREAGTRPQRSGDIVGEQEAAVARACQMYPLARGTQLRRPDKFTTAAQQR